MPAKLASRVLLSGQARRSFADLSDCGGGQHKERDAAAFSYPLMILDAKGCKIHGRRKCLSSLCVSNSESKVLEQKNVDQPRDKTHDPGYERGKIKGSIWKRVSVVDGEALIFGQKVLKTYLSVNADIWGFFGANCSRGYLAKSLQLKLDPVNQKRISSSDQLSQQQAEIKTEEVVFSKNHSSGPKSNDKYARRKTFSFEGRNDYETMLSEAAKDTVTSNDPVDKKSVWKKYSHELKRGVKSSKRRVFSWLFKLKTIAGRKIEPNKKSNSQLDADKAHLPNTSTCKRNANVDVPGKRTGTISCQSIYSKAPGGGFNEKKDIAFLSIPEQIETQKAETLKRQASMTALMHTSFTLGESYVTDETTCLSSYNAMVDCSKKRKVARQMILSSPFTSAVFSRAASICRKELSVEEPVRKVSLEYGTSSSNSDGISIGSEIWEADNIPKYFEGQASHEALNYQCYSSAPSSFISNEGDKGFFDGDLSHSFRCSCTDDSSSSDEERKKYQSFLRPLSLVPSSLGLSLLCDRNKSHKNSDFAYVTDKSTSLQAIYCNYQLESDSRSSASSTISEICFLKELKLVRKRNREGRQNISSIPFSDEELDFRKAESPSLPAILHISCDELPLDQSSLKAKQLTISRKNQKGAIKNEKSEIRKQAPKKNKRQKIKLWLHLRRNKSGHFSSERKILKLFSNFWNKKHQSVEPLWIALSLDRNTECQDIRRQFVRGENLYLFADAFEVLRATFEFSDNTLKLANRLEPDTSNENSLNEELFVAESDSLKFYLKPIKGTLVFPNCEVFNNTAFLQASYSSRNFEQPKSARHRKSMDDNLWAMVVSCRRKVLELKIRPSYEKYLLTLDSFRDCFRFCRDKYAIVARLQVFEYVSHLAETRNEILSIFETLVDVGYEYTILIDYLVATAVSEESVQKTKNKLKNLQITLAVPAKRLDEVLLAISCMKESFPGYVIPMVKLAQTAVLSRIEIVETYQEFCLLNLGYLTDIAEWHKHTRFDDLIHELEFLMDRMELFQASTLEDVLDSLLNSFGIVSVLKKTLEQNFAKINFGVARNELERTVASGKLSHFGSIHCDDIVPVMSRDGFVVADRMPSPLEVLLHQADTTPAP